MPFIPVEGTVQVEFLVSCNGQTVENVLHFTRDDLWTIADMETLASQLVAWWSSDIRPLVHTLTSLTQLRLTDLQTAISPVVFYNTGLPLVGTGASPSVPNNVSTVLTKRTFLRGRSFRGRIYTYGMMESQMDGDAINGAVTTAYINAYTNILALTVGAVPVVMTVVSRQQNGVPLTAGVATQVVTITSDGVVDSQRRRLRGRGN